MSLLYKKGVSVSRSLCNRPYNECVGTYLFSLSLICNLCSFLCIAGVVTPSKVAPHRMSKNCFLRHDYDDALFDMSYMARHSKEIN